MRDYGEMQPVIDELNQMTESHINQLGDDRPERQPLNKKVRRPRPERKQRGVFERVRGSGEWWIRYVDSDGCLRREKAGSKGDAIDLYGLRKADALRRRKLPEKLRRRVVRFAEIADDAAKYTKANNEGHASDCYRISKLNKEFGQRPAESIPIEAFRDFFDSQEWEPGTYNRMRTVLFAIYRLGIENNKVTVNPAKLLKRKKVCDDRVRFLNQFEPLCTEIDYLKPLQSEEARLRAVIDADYSEHMEEFEISLNTGLRRKEQYILIEWASVDLVRKDLHVPPSKNGEGRHVSLNAEARAAFERLRQRKIGDGPVPIRVEGPIFVSRNGDRLLGARHWFEDAIEKAGIQHFTWHDLRHTFASRLVMADVDIRTVAELMGHKKIQMTMRYAHLAPEHKLVAVERLSSYNP
jgi:integrase